MGDWVDGMTHNGTENRKDRVFRVWTDRHPEREAYGTGRETAQQTVEYSRANLDSGSRFEEQKILA